MTKDELYKRTVNDFKYHAPSEEQQKKYVVIRSAALGVATLFIDLCPLSRELSTALTKLEECVMHANAAIARNPEV